MLTDEQQVWGSDDGVVEVLAGRYGIDESLVRDIYRKELNELQIGSRIKSFLPILCGRRVKQVIIERYCK